MLGFAFRLQSVDNHLLGSPANDMAKILLLALAIWLLYAVVKRYLGSVDSQTRPPAGPEDMVQCAYCGVHLPKSDSLVVNQQHYCCEEHSRQAKP